MTIVWLEIGEIWKNGWEAKQLQKEHQRMKEASNKVFSWWRHYLLCGLWLTIIWLQKHDQHLHWYWVYVSHLDDHTLPTINVIPLCSLNNVTRQLSNILMKQTIHTLIENHPPTTTLHLSGWYDLACLGLRPNPIFSKSYPGCNNNVL